MGPSPPGHAASVLGRQTPPPNFCSSRGRGCPRKEHTQGPAGREVGQGNSDTAWAGSCSGWTAPAPPRCPPLPEQVAPLCRHPHPNLSPPGNTEERQPPRTPTGQGQGHKHALVGRFHEDTGFFSYFSFCSISCPQRASNQDLTPSLNHLCAAFSHVQRSDRRGAGRGRGGACSGRGPLGGGAGRS